MAGLTYNDVELGYNLPSRVKTVTQEMINAYADASLDFNRIHLDAEFCKQINFLGVGSTIAHGTFNLAFIGQAITDWVYPLGGRLRHLDVKYINPVFPGDTLTVNASVIEKHPRDDDQNFLVFEVNCVNQNGKTVIVGEASAYLP